MSIAYQREVLKPSIRKVDSDEFHQMLGEFEHKYGMSSEVFYRKAEKGELEEEDDFIDWLGLCKAYLREQSEQYR